MVLDRFALTQSNIPLVAGLEAPLSSVQTLSNFITNPILWVDADAQLIFANPSAHCLFNWTPEVLKAQTLYDLNLGFSSEIWPQQWKTLQQEQTLSFEVCYSSAIGQEVPVSVKVLSLNDQCACIVIGDRERSLQQPPNSSFTAEPCKTHQSLFHECGYKSNEAQLEESISLLQATLEAAASGVVAIKHQTEIASFNQKFVHLWQIPDAVMASKDCRSLQTFIRQQLKCPEALCLIEVERTATSEQYSTLELKDGRIFERYTKPLHSQHSFGSVWSFRDITERKDTETALRESEAKFRTLAETTNAIIFITQGNQFCYVNPAAEAITGYRKEELLSHPDIRELIQEQGRVNLQDFSDQKEIKHCQEIKILTQSGEERWLDCSVGVIEFAGKLAVLGTAIDITHRKQAEVEIQQALEQEKELSALRERFIHVVSHEFRTPLNNIAIATSSLIRYSNQWTEGEKLTYLHSIKTDVEQLSQLLDEVLTLSRAEIGKFPFNPKPLDLEQFCINLISEMQLSDKKYAFSFTSRGNCGGAYMDEKLLRPILTNLFSNAMKYSSLGCHIDLEVCCHKQTVTFQIKDVGIGIPVADQQHLFEPFLRGSNVGEIPGTGLGLAVVKKLVDLQGGHICAASEVGVGTTFRLTLPLSQTSESEDIPLIFGDDC